MTGRRRSADIYRASAARLADLVVVADDVCGLRRQRRAALLEQVLERLGRVRVGLERLGQRRLQRLHVLGLLRRGFCVFCRLLAGFARQLPLDPGPDGLARFSGGAFGGLLAEAQEVGRDERDGGGGGGGGVHESVLSLRIRRWDGDPPPKIADSGIPRRSARATRWRVRCRAPRKTPNMFAPWRPSIARVARASARSMVQVSPRLLAGLRAPLR